MAKVDLDFLMVLQDAIEYIDEYSFDIYILQHSGDPYYLKIVQTLISHLDRKLDPIYGLPPDTTNWNIDDLCQWYVFYNYDFRIINIPAAFTDYWNYNLEARRSDGTYKRRTPFRINQPKSVAQKEVWDVFLRARDCFKKQWDWHAVTNPSTGYKSRGYWYNAAGPSGLYYYTYFMRETLKIMFGPKDNDQYPFANQQTPDWCEECNQAEKWAFTQMAADDFIYCMHDLSIFTGTYSHEITIGATSDPGSPTPGDLNTLKIKVGVQAINAEQEPTGPISFQEFDPIGTGWITANLVFSAGANTAGVYLSVTCNNGNGDYFLYFRNAEQKDFAGRPQLIINGANGNSFGWDVGAGDFSFHSFVFI